MIPFMGGGAKQRMINHRLCRRYDWTQKPGYSNIETYPYVSILEARRLSTLLASNTIINGGWGGLSPLAPDKLCPCSLAHLIMMMQNL